MRPNFFCGQLLTDADLGAMVDWTRKRLALSRYRDGWGIVCGLDLSCSEPADGGACCDNGKHANGPAVWLTQGYAVDCCGNDLVVCDPMRIDLGSVCRPPDDPCDPNPPPQPDRPVRPVRGDRTCFDVDKEHLFAVRVVLRYHEDLAQGQRAMFRGGGACGNTEACEYARILERPCVHLEVVPLPDEDDTTEEEKFVEDFRRRIRQMFQEMQDLLKKGPEAVVDHLRRHPPYQACYLMELACCLRNKNKDAFDLEDAVKIGGLMVADAMGRELGQCTCFACKPDDGVSLGIVLMQRTVEGRNVTCKVYSIDADARHRRRLKPQLCQRLLSGDLALLRYLGQSEQVVKREFAETGVRVEPVDRMAVPIATLDELSDVVNRQTLRLNPLERRELNAHVVVDPLGTRRIIAFE
ncbi:hypothetical protein LF41_3019 [Lysobacter dokdonensis DS-58]|uniref:Uncharacterized protein n=1 Tax=Lysobacter dokdonensis DS-58 TaxID=1300345 RepID=A0A0A2X298_9GAMM|nr:hypothetical protein LF41_3019 [Lysobacter dokdonensis DS-58]